MRNKIFLIGFRAVGKTAVGVELARELGWDFIDMDEEIVIRAGKSVFEITEGGKSWQEFRQLEQDLLADLLRGKNIVVAMGGGAPVNNVIKEGTGVEFGRRNADMLIAEDSAFVVLLEADDDVIRDRIKSDEMRKSEISRPILDEKKARELELRLELYKDDSEKRKEVIVEEILDDSMQILQLRKPLYKAVAQIEVDTGKMRPREVAKEIIKNL